MLLYKLISAFNQWPTVKFLAIAKSTALIYIRVLELFRFVQLKVVLGSSIGLLESAIKRGMMLILEANTTAFDVRHKHCLSEVAVYMNLLTVYLILGSSTSYNEFPPPNLARDGCQLLSVAAHSMSKILRLLIGEEAKKT